MAKRENKREMRIKRSEERDHVIETGEREKREQRGKRERKKNVRERR